MARRGVKIGVIVVLLSECAVNGARRKAADGILEVEPSQSDAVACHVDTDCANLPPSDQAHTCVGDICVACTIGCTGPDDGYVPFKVLHSSSRSCSGYQRDLYDKECKNGFIPQERYPSEYKRMSAFCQKQDHYQEMPKSIRACSDEQHLAVSTEAACVAAAYTLNMIAKEYGGEGISRYWSHTENDETTPKGCYSYEMGDSRWITFNTHEAGAPPDEKDRLICEQAFEAVPAPDVPLQSTPGTSPEESTPEPTVEPELTPEPTQEPTPKPKPTPQPTREPTQPLTPEPTMDLTQESAPESQKKSSGQSLRLCASLSFAIFVALAVNFEM